MELTDSLRKSRICMQTPNINVKACRRPHFPSSERRRTRERIGPSSAPTETLMRQFMLSTCAVQHHAGSDVTEASDSTEGCRHAGRRYQNTRVNSAEASPRARGPIGKGLAPFDVAIRRKDGGVRHVRRCSHVLRVTVTWRHVGLCKNILMTWVKHMDGSEPPLSQLTLHAPHGELHHPLRDRSSMGAICTCQK